MTTPECPKGPERGARPEELASLKNRIESAIVWARHDYDRNENLVISREAAANAAWSEVGPELERLTAEVEHHKRQHELWARLHTGEHEFVESLLTQGEIGIWLVAESRELLRGMARRASALRRSREKWRRLAGEQVNERVADMAASMANAGQLRAENRRVKAERDEDLAEVSRLREQLAAQPKLPVDAEDQLRIAVADPGSRLPRIHYTPERASEPVSRWSTRAVLDLLKSWGIASRASATSAASPIVHSVLLSSDTGVMGEWQAFCSGCRQRSVGDLAHAEFWKDQHLADTLTNESFISPQQAADELSRQSQEFGCVRVDLVSQWQKGDKALYKAHPEDEGEECQIIGVALDTAIVEADPFPFGNPQRWSADLSELHQLPPREPSCEEVVPEGPEDASLCGQDVVPGSDRCADHGGRPSGSTATPRSDGALLHRLRILVADLQSPGTGTKGEAYDSGFQDGQIQAGNDLEALLDEYAPDAAPAAGSEATPEDPPRNKWREMSTSLRSPSPSLRKEGEDTPMPAVSSQEEKKEGETG